MTELVQKGTLPTLEQLDDAGKAVVVNPAGSNYTLGTAQSGAYVPPISRIDLEANSPTFDPSGPWLLWDTHYGQVGTDLVCVTTPPGQVHVMTPGIYAFTVTVNFGPTPGNLQLRSNGSADDHFSYAPANKPTAVTFIDHLTPGDPAVLIRCPADISDAEMTAVRIA